MASKPPPDNSDTNINTSPSQPPTTPMPNPFTSALPTAPSSDPPPPLPADIENPTAQEDAALDIWLRRNTSYVTTIPWHRYTMLPSLSPLWGYSDADYRAECLESLFYYTRASGRRLSDFERDALLEPVTRCAVAASYDRPLALGVAAWLMARSWAKSGRRAAAAAAQELAPPLGTVGTVGADGHITHFSHPHAGAQSRSQVLSSLVRRVARTGAVGLACGVGYYALWTPWRYLLGVQEVECIREDLRLEGMCQDMDRNTKDKVAELLRRHGGY